MMTQPLYAQPVTPAASHPYRSDGSRLVSSDGAELPLRGSVLRSEAGGGLARTVLTQTFANSGPDPVHVTYMLPLPANGAVSGYSFTLAGRTTRGVIDRKESARERFEQAVLEGRSAALLDEERSSLFKQEIGNLPPGVALEIEVVIDHPLSWHAGGWELRFPTVVAPRYQGEAGRVTDSSTTELAVDAGGVEARSELRLQIGDALTDRPSSPSHALVTHKEGEKTLVRFDEARLDRDVVVRWSVAQSEPGLTLETARPLASNPRARSAFGLLTLVPPRVSTESVPRDLIVLIDTSGSMSGEPLAQAVRLVSALVETLGQQDQLELIEFSWKPRRWKRKPQPVSAENRARALAWLGALEASGGTEMKSGIDAALTPLRAGAQRQIVLVSDGLIGFEREIVDSLAERLPNGCRFHCVGVGHGVNRSLTAPAARAGRGVEIIVTPGEDVAPAQERLLRRTAEPLVVNLRIEGSALEEGPTRAPDLFSGSPALLCLRLKPQGGELILRGDTVGGEYCEHLDVAGTELESGPERVLALYARERVEDAEVSRAAGADVDGEVESLGLDFQISTRLTSWVAVSDEQTVDPTKATRRIEQPHELTADMSCEGLGLRGAAAFGAAGRAMPASMTLIRRQVLSPPAAGPVPGGPPPMRAPQRLSLGSGVEAPKLEKKKRGLMDRVRDLFRDDEPAAVAEEETTEAAASAASFGLAGELMEGGGLAEESELATTLEGQVLLASELRLVVAVDLLSALDWRLPTEVTVKFESGEQLTLTVESKYSTAAGRLQVGQRLRLSLALDSALSGAVTQVTFTIDGAPVVIILQP